MEKTMDDASQAALDPALPPFVEADRFDDPLPAQSIHFAVPPQRTLTWRLNAHATLRVHSAQLWVTRARSPYDHWMRPGETLRLERGERIWLSTDDALPVRVTITSAWRPPFADTRRAIERIAAWLALLTLRRSREA
jgi:hypothetical protein